MRMYSVNVSFSFKLAIEIQIVCESNDYFYDSNKYMQIRIQVGIVEIWGTISLLNS